MPDDDDEYDDDDDDDDDETERITYPFFLFLYVYIENGREGLLADRRKAITIGRKTLWTVVTYDLHKAVVRERFASLTREMTRAHPKNFYDFSSLD